MTSGDLRPVITVKLTDTRADLSERVLFSCEFQCRTEFRVNWYHNGILITQSNEKYIIKHENNRSILIILNIQVEDSGYYEFRIQNKFGISSSNAKLTVIQSKYLKIIFLNFFKIV